MLPCEPWFSVPKILLHTQQHSHGCKLMWLYALQAALTHVMTLDVATERLVHNKNQMEVVKLTMLMCPVCPKYVLPEHI